MIRHIIKNITRGLPPGNERNPSSAGPARVAPPSRESRPWVKRLVKYQPVFALATGYASAWLLRRGFEYLPLIIVLSVFAYTWVIYPFRLSGDRKGSRIVKFTDFALLFALNNMLFFVIPFYFESMTFFSRNVLFGLVMLGLTIISNWFVLYNRLVQRLPLAGSVFYALTFFIVLNFIFPVLFGMRNIWSLLLSGAIAGLSVVLIVFPRVPSLRERRNAVKFLSGIALSLAAVWFGRSLIPPAPLKMTSSAACERIVDYQPVSPLKNFRGDGSGEIFFYTSIFAPLGLSEGIEHVWYHDGRQLFRVDVKEIHGGRKEGFGTWSKHPPREGPGEYIVEAWTKGGQLLGRGGFTFILEPGVGSEGP